MTGWRACGMLAFHPYRTNQLKVIPWTAESVHRMTFIDASLPNGHAASTCSLDVKLHYYKFIRGAAAPFGRCVIAQLRVN